MIVTHQIEINEAVAMLCDRYVPHSAKIKIMIMLIIAKVKTAPKVL